MQFPLGFNDTIFWLAISAIILLATSEIINPNYCPTGIIIKKDRFRKVAFILGILFLLIITIRIYQIIVTTIRQ